MLNLSYADVFSIRLQREYAEDIGVGDLVRTGENAFPHFTVLAVHDGKAWVRNVQNHQDSVIDLDRCRKLAGELAA